MKYQAILVVIFITVGGLSCQKMPQRPNVTEPELRQGDYHSEEEAKLQLAEFSRTYSTLEEWKLRATGR